MEPANNRNSRSKRQFFVESSVNIPQYRIIPIETQVPSKALSKTSVTQCFSRPDFALGPDWDLKEQGPYPQRTMNFW